MFKYILLVAVLSVALASDPQPANRFFAQTKTSTLIVLSTTTIPTTVKKTCWTSGAAALTQCRRRRGIEEQPAVLGLDIPLNEILKPTQVVPLEATQQVSLDDISAAVAQKTENSSTDLDSSAEVEIAGFENCLGRSAFGITLLYTEKTTIVITERSSVTVGSSTYTLASCFPNILANSRC